MVMLAEPLLRMSGSDSGERRLQEQRAACR